MASSVALYLALVSLAGSAAVFAGYERKRGQADAGEIHFPETTRRYYRAISGGLLVFGILAAAATASTRCYRPPPEPLPMILEYLRGKENCLPDDQGVGGPSKGNDRFKSVLGWVAMTLACLPGLFYTYPF